MVACATSLIAPVADIKLDGFFFARTPHPCFKLQTHEAEVRFHPWAKGHAAE
jgi:hypothetical protein